MANDEDDLPGLVKKVIIIFSVPTIISVFGWHFYTTSEMTKAVEVNSYRTGQIVQALPEMRRFIAREELNKPIDGVLVATRPIQVDDSWFMYAYFANPLEGQQHIYTMSLSGEGDFSPAYSLIGAVEHLTDEHFSFAQMAAWSADVDEPATFPSLFDTDSSFIFRGDSYEALQEYLAEYAGPPTTVSLEHRPSSWPAVLIYTNDDIAKVLYERRDEDEE